MPNIILDPDELWEYFVSNAEELTKEKHLIASFEDYGIEIYVESSDDLPYITVEVDDEEIDGEFCLSANDCEETAEKLYERYIDNAFSTLSGTENDNSPWVNDDDEDEYYSANMWKCANEEGYEFDGNTVFDGLDYGSQSIAIDEREEELDDALMYFLEAACEGQPCIFLDDDEIEEIKDHFCEYLWKKYKLHIYRPMWLEDENGEEFFSNYPYEVMIYDEEESD